MQCGVQRPEGIQLARLIIVRERNLIAQKSPAIRSKRKVPRASAPMSGREVAPTPAAIAEVNGAGLYHRYIALHFRDSRILGARVHIVASNRARPEGCCDGGCDVAARPVAVPCNRISEISMNNK